MSTMLADRVQMLSNDLFDELVTQVGDLATENLKKVILFTLQSNYRHLQPLSLGVGNFLDMNIHE